MARRQSQTDNSDLVLLGGAALLLWWLLRNKTGSLVTVKEGI